MGHTLLSIFAAAVVPLFFAGMAGSALVVVVTVIRDLQEVTTPDDVDVQDL